MTYPGQSFGDPGSATRQATVVLNADVGNYASQMGVAAQQTSALAGAVDQLQQKMGGFDKWAGKKLIHFATGDVAVLGSAAADAATFEKQLSTLSATAAITGRSMSGLKNGIESAASQFPNSRGEIIALTEALTNLGITGDAQISKLTKVFLKLGAATGENSIGLAQGLVQLSRLMGSTDATQVGNFANSLLVVSKNAGVSASGVLSFAQAIAPLARQAGVSESAVLGISTAFNKAGADGYVAANTFNSIVSDITQLTQTGSPELSKYANLIGVTVKQFKGMDKTTALVDIFDTISKMGPKAISVLNQMGIDGVRAQSAIAAVTQSGNLRGSIAEAIGAQGDQHALDKGAKAATDGFADSLARLKNKLTEIGTILGTTFLKPLTMITNGMGHLTSIVTGTLKPLSSLIGLAAGAGAVFGSVGGLAMSAAGLIGSVALLKMLGRGGPAGAARAGFAAEQSGLSKDPNSSHYRFQTGYNTGGLSWTQRRMYEGGTAMGQAFRYAGGGEESLPIRNMLLAAPFRAVRALNTGQGRFLRESIRDYWGRENLRSDYQSMPMRERWGNFVASTRGKDVPTLLRDETKAGLGSAGNVIGATAQAGISQAAPIARLAFRLFGPSAAATMLGGMFGIPRGGALTNAGMHAATKAAGPANLDEATSQLKSKMGTLGTSMVAVMHHPVGASKALGGALGDATKAAARFGVKLAQAATGTVLSTGWNVGRQIGAAGFQMARTLGRYAFSWQGIAAMAAGQYAMGKFRNSDKQGELGPNLNPIQKYNDLLGTTTNNLANFNGALKNAAEQLGSTAMTMSQALTVNPGDASRAPNKAVNPFWNRIKDHSTKESRPAFLAAALSEMPLTDPKQVDAAKEDMFAAGFKDTEISAALNLYKKRGGAGPSGVGKEVDWANIGRLSTVDEGTGKIYSGRPKANKAGAELLGLLTSGVESRRQTEEATIGSVYAQQHALKGYTQGLAPLADKIKHDGNHNARVATMDSLANTLATITGGKASSYMDWISKHHEKEIGNSVESQEQYIATALGQTKEGKNWISRLKTHGGTDIVGGIDAAMGTLALTPDRNSENGILLRSGGIGRFAAKNADVQAAMVDTNSPGKTGGAVNTMMTESLKVGKSLEGAAGQMSKLMGTIGNPSDPLYKMAQTVQGQAIQQQGYQAAYQTRGQNFRAAITGYQTATAAYNETPKEKRTQDQYDFVQSQKGAYEQSLGEQQNYLQQMYQTAKSAGVQNARAEEDMYGKNGQLARARRDFHTQMLNAEFDYNRQQDRAAADHNTQLRQQAEQAAQSIYDPYKRVQSEYTTDSGTLVQNLDDQNARLAKQRAQLKQAKKMGLSTQAIQELDLANPANAQQLNSLIGTLTPEQAKKIDQQIAARVKNTKGLTQNPYNLAFTQGEKDYKKQLDRAAQDYKHATDVATAQQHVALGDMVTDYNKQVKRAGEDLTTAMTDVTGTFGTMYDKTMGQIASSVAKFSPKAAGQMRKDLRGLVDEFPFLKHGDASGYNGAGPSTTAGTVGVNAKGQTGYYDSHGKFYSVKGAGINTATLPQIAPPPKPKPKHNTSSGHPHMSLAQGGITVGPTLAMVSEWAPNAAEAHIPLNDRGASFMSQVISKSLLQQMHTSGRGVAGSGGNKYVTISEDHSTRFTGDMHITAADYKDLMRQLDAKRRLGRLQSPRHG